jgi:hypothetical protein
MIPSRVEHADVLDLIRFSASFVGTDLVTPANPSAVYLLIRDPRSQQVASYRFGASGASIMNPAVGAFYKEQVASYSGKWTFAWIGEGVVQVMEEFHILVDASEILG